MSNVRPEFEALVEQIKAEKKSVKILPKTLLFHFYCERRTKYNNIMIQNYLDDNGLETSPHFIYAYLWNDIELRLKKKVRIKKDDQPNSDPTNRITFLPSANKAPTTINRDATINEAITVMMLNGYSQLPVTSDNRKIDGLITWETIGQKIIQQTNQEFVRDCMTKDVEIVKYDSPLFDAIKKIIQKKVVLVRSADNTLSGLVTTSDISRLFMLLTEPFLILEEIENFIRRILDNKFTIEEIQDLANSNPADKEINVISDLTFGQYIRIMELPDNWNRFELKIDRATFIKRLNAVRRIRNDVMHFHPDGISDGDKQLLRDTAIFFSKISESIR